MFIQHDGTCGTETRGRAGIKNILFKATQCISDWKYFRIKENSIFTIMYMAKEPLEVDGYIVRDVVYRDMWGR